jgi:hypothetical protein
MRKIFLALVASLLVSVGSAGKLKQAIPANLQASQALAGANPNFLPNESFIPHPLILGDDLPNLTALDAPAPANKEERELAAPPKKEEDEGEEVADRDDEEEEDDDGDASDAEQEEDEESDEKEADEESEEEDEEPEEDDDEERDANE